MKGLAQYANEVVHSYLRPRADALHLDNPSPLVPNSFNIDAAFVAPSNFAARPLWIDGLDCRSHALFTDELSDGRNQEAVGQRDVRANSAIIDRTGYS